MGKIVELRAGKSTILVETVDLSQSDEQSMVQDTGLQESVTRNLDKLLEVIKPISESISRSFDGIQKKPSSTSVEFGLSFTVEGNIVLVKAAGEASIKVIMTWDNK